MTISTIRLCKTIFRGPATLQTGLIPWNLRGIRFPSINQLNGRPVDILSPIAPDRLAQTSPFACSFPDAKPGKSLVMIQELALTMNQVRSLQPEGLLLATSSIFQTSMIRTIKIPVAIPPLEQNTQYRSVITSNGHLITCSIIKGNANIEENPAIKQDGKRLEDRTAIFQLVKGILQPYIKESITAFVLNLPADCNFVGEPFQMGLDVAFNYIGSVIGRNPDYLLEEFKSNSPFLEIREHESTPTCELTLQRSQYQLYSAIIGKEWAKSLNLIMQLVLHKLLITPPSTEDVKNLIRRISDEFSTSVLRYKTFY